MKHLLLLIALLPSALFAQDNYGRVDILHGWQNADGSYQTAIAIDLEDGWKTYWRVAGPAGIPPSFNWTKSSNIGNISWTWPTPKVFNTNGLMSIGYSGPLMVPVTITPADPNRPVNINVDLEFGVCSDICIPADVNLRQTVDANTSGERIAEIRAAIADVPLTASQAGMQKATCTLTPNATGFDIQANLRFARTPRGPQQLIIEYKSPDIWIKVAETTVDGRNMTGVTQLEYYGDGMLALDRSKLQISIIQDHKIVEFFGCPAA